MQHLEMMHIFNIFNRLNRSRQTQYGELIMQIRALDLNISVFVVSFIPFVHSFGRSFVCSYKSHIVRMLIVGWLCVNRKKEHFRPNRMRLSLDSAFGSFEQITRLISFYQSAVERGCF